MLSRIIDLIGQSRCRIADGTLYCEDYTVGDTGCLEYLEDQHVLESPLLDRDPGAVIRLELSLARLNALGYYEDTRAFVVRNRYRRPEHAYLIREDPASPVASDVFISRYLAVVDFMDALRGISRHVYLDVDVVHCIIFREDRSAFLPLQYTEDDILSMHSGDTDKLHQITGILSGQQTEQKLLFINELTDFVSARAEARRFPDLLSGIAGFYDRCMNAYQYYLRDFSYNRFKVELDSKALEFTQKIQSVINDAQTKLIAIPTAFVLVAATLDFEDPAASKNIFSLLGLFIFSVLIQLFINNQKTSLNLIGQHIRYYQDTFRQHSMEEVRIRFASVEREIGVQRRRLRITMYMLWLVPVALSGVLLCLYLLRSGYNG